MVIVGQIIGGVGIVANIIILQQKTRRGLLTAKFISDILWTAHYLLIGAYSGAGICIVALFRELVFMNRRTKKWANHKIWPALFICAALVSAALTWQGAKTILPTTASVVSIIGYWIGIPRISRILLFPAAAGMTTYDIMVGSVFGVVNEALGVISAIVGIIRLDMKKSAKGGKNTEAKMKKLLVVVDMQNDFIDGSLGSPEAVKIVDKVKALIENYDGDVVFTRDTHMKNYLSTQEGRNLPVEHCIKGTSGWEISSALDTGKRKIFNKPTFGSTELGEYVRVCGYDKVDLCGLCTDICVVSNAMVIKAFAPEAEVTVIADCSAGVTPAQHDAALDALAPCQIKVTGRGLEPWRE